MRFALNLHQLAAEFNLILIPSPLNIGNDFDSLKLRLGRYFAPEYVRYAPWVQIHRI